MSFANANTDYRKLLQKLPHHWKKAQGHNGFPSDVKNTVVGQTQLRKSKVQSHKTVKQGQYAENDFIYLDKLLLPK